MVIVSDDMVVSEDLFSKPLIISQVTYDDANVLEPYAYNNPNNISYRASLNHTFINNCYVLNTVTPTYLVLCGLWALIAILWYVIAFWVKRNQTIFLQRVLLMLPCCKFMETMINGLFYNACPWLSA